MPDLTAVEYADMIATAFRDNRKAEGKPKTAKPKPEPAEKLMSGQLNKHPEPLAGKILFSLVVKAERCATEYHPDCVKVLQLDTGRSFEITIKETTPIK